MEADFRREYGIRLRQELPQMGWHEFKNLLRGLSTDSALRRNWRAVPRQGPQAARAFWDQLASLRKGDGLCP